MSDLTNHGVSVVLHPVSDLAAATNLYAALLGTAPAYAADDYVGFEVGGQHVGLLPGGGPQGLASPLTYWRVDDLDATLDALTAAGATVTEAAHAVAPGRRVATVSDLDGNQLGLAEDS